MTHVPARFRQLVIDWSRGRCEYCHLQQAGQEATFHIDHVTPVAVGGETVVENLAFACVSCSLRKSARDPAGDPITGNEIPLYNPRTDAWAEHFAWSGFRLTGLTAMGRATIELLERLKIKRMPSGGPRWGHLKSSSRL